MVKAIVACAGVLLLVGHCVNGVGPHRSLHRHCPACLGGKRARRVHRSFLT